MAVTSGALLRSGRKLSAFSDELKKITKEAETYLSTCAVLDGKQSNDSRWLLTKSCALLKKCLSRIQEIQDDIERRFAEDVYESELSYIVGSVDPVQVHAEMVLAEVEAKLSYLDNIGNRSPSSHETTASESGVESKFISLETLKRTSELTESTGILLNAPLAFPVKSNSTLRLTENEDVPAKEDSSKEEESSEESSQVSVSGSETENNDQNGTPEKQTCCEFNLKQFYGDETNFKPFLLEFHETIGKSPLETKYKFAALRSMIRGSPYQIFLDLDYQKDEDYKKALVRLCNKFPNQLNGVELANSPSRPMPSFAEVECSYTGPERWSDEYFMRKYCHEAPNYEKPSRSLLTEAIRAFLNLYVVGPKKVSNHDFLYVWLILLHGVKFQDRYMVDSTNKDVFRKSKRVTFPKMNDSTRENLFKFAPSIIQKKDDNEEKPKFWEWTYVFVETDGTKKKETITTRTFKDWYKNCWDSVQNCDDETFQHRVNYFALLSMVLFRVTVKEPESVERYVISTFNKIVRPFCPTPPVSNTSVIPPPHSGVYKLIRRTVFKRHGPNFQKYLTYLVGCYAFSRADVKHVIRNYLNAGCLLTLLGTGIGSIYWLRKAAECKSMKPQNLLKFFLIDPSMENQVKKVHRFIETYRREVTWWWARLFENHLFKEVSTAYCPAFVFACFVVRSTVDADIEKSLEFPQFSPFLKNDMSARLRGKNLGVVIRDLIIEWDQTPYSLMTKGFHKQREMDRCCFVDLSTNIKKN